MLGLRASMRAMKGVDDLDRRKIAPTDAQRQLGGAHVSQFVRQRHLVCLSEHADVRSSDLSP